jgi:ADP-heptose:LPS heptosyltransferase
MLKETAVCVGYPKEHEIFEYTFGHSVRYYPTPDILTLARVIAGCEKFIGNSSFPHALAEGMKKDLVCEVFRVAPNTIFKRPGAQYV